MVSRVKGLLRQGFAFAAILAAFALGMRSRRAGTDVLLWGPTPIISNKYWSEAMRQAGWDSRTFMSHHYGINRRDDFDLYFEDVVPRSIWPRRLRRELAPFFAFSYIIRNAAVLHPSFLGGPLGQTPFWRLEAFLIRRAGIRTVVQPYGGDIYMYSRITDPAVRHGLMLSYPDAGKTEQEIAERVQYWSRHADVIIAGTNLDGLGRWDVPVGNDLCIDTGQWQAKASYSAHDGTNGPVKVMHAPNHRGVKGTEFLIAAIEQLNAEGLQVELVLLENVPNERVRALMQEVDILADQFVLPGYGLNAIEGMASGLPAMCNMEDEDYAQVFRRYSFLDECPIVSVSVETIKTSVRALVVDPRLREDLGRAGRQFAEKYHSYAAAQYLFGSVYDKILHGKDVDLMNLFHPLKSDYNRRMPHVRHPLVNSHIPAERGA